MLIFLKLAAALVNRIVSAQIASNYSLSMGNEFNVEPNRILACTPNTQRSGTGNGINGTRWTNTRGSDRLGKTTC